ncbi:MAG TPA: fatty acid desaturase, partial [Polyangiales bacterium]|nr:fatty acid desaturase [Polyangiales bacterium]
MAAMDDVPRELLQAAYKRKHRYLYKIPLAYGAWVACWYVLTKVQGTAYGIVVGLLCSWLIANLIRGLGAIAHDAVHGSVSKNKTIGYWASLLCWAPTGMSVTLYTNYHLHHHKIANTYPDVDNVVISDYAKSPGTARALLLTIYL